MDIFFVIFFYKNAFVQGLFKPQHYINALILILVWSTSWTPAVGGLFVCE